jgi:hypothetical protein
METMFLEDFSFIEKYELFESELEGEKKFLLRGVFSRVDHPNKNKRIYSRPVMEESINSINETISNRGLVGELDHPPTPKINVKGISHVITKLHIAEDGAVLGEAEALDTEPGRTLRELMKANVRLGVSTRGVGSVEPYNGPLVKEGTGYVNVKPGYRMKAIDIVFDPSQESFPNYVREELENHFEPKVIVGATANFSKVWEDVFG